MESPDSHSPIEDIRGNLGSRGDVLAHIKFMKWTKEVFDKERPFEYYMPPPKGTRNTNIAFEEHQVLVQDGRHWQSDSFNLDDHGFSLRHWPSDDKMIDFTSRDSIERLYLPRVSEFIRRTVDGAETVRIFDWRVRDTSPFEPGHVIDLNNPADRLGPVKHAHVDQSPLGVINRVISLYPNEYKSLLAGRVQLINVWRPLETVQSWPLALCDGSTIQHETDLVEVDHIRKTYVGYTYNLLHRDYHSWHYFSQQTKDEVLVFKIFDSVPPGRAACCPHVSFSVEDDTERECAKPRKSIEVRALVFSSKAGK